MPEKVKRTIIAYGRIKAPSKNVQELYTRVQLHEVTSDEVCGELAVGLHWIEKAEEPLTMGRMLSLESEFKSSLSSMDRPNNNDSTVVLTLDGLQEVDSTAAEAVTSEDLKEIANGCENGGSQESVNLSANMLFVPEPARVVPPPRSSSPNPSVSSSRSSLAEDTDFEDEEKLTQEMMQEGHQLHSPIPSYREDDVVGVLSVEVVAALNLPRPKRFLRNPSHQANPFCTISFGKRSFRTKAKTNTCNPIWKEKLAL